MADWTDDQVVKLRALWAEGFSTAEIGRRMRISKNGIVGKAHRLNLPPRPSPIRREGAGEAVPRAPRVLTQRQSAANATALLPVVSDAGVPAIIPAAEAGPAMRPLNIAPGRAKKCCFPFGEPRRPDFRYCDAPVYSAGVYCAEHAAICFVRVRTEATPWG